MGIDVERLLAEALTKHRIRLDPHDPAIVLVTLNRLEDAVECVAADIRKATREYEDAANRVQSRLGAAIATRLKAGADLGASPAKGGPGRCCQGRSWAMLPVPPCSRRLSSTGNARWSAISPSAQSAGKYCSRNTNASNADTAPLCRRRANSRTAANRASP